MNVFIFPGLLDSVIDTHLLSFLLCYDMAHALLGRGAQKTSLFHLLNFLGRFFFPHNDLGLEIGRNFRDSDCSLNGRSVRMIDDTVEHWGLKLTKLDRSLLQGPACAAERVQCLGSREKKVAEGFHSRCELPEWVFTHPPPENRAEHLDRLTPQALKSRWSCNFPPLLELDPRLPLKLSMKHFLQELEKGDLHIHC